MIDYFKEIFQKIADFYNGEYYVQEAIIGGMHGSSLPFSRHGIIVPYKTKNIYFNIEFGGTASATVKVEVERIVEPNFFQFKKEDHFLSLLKRNKRSLFVVSENEDINLTIEEILTDTGVEHIASETLFEPTINFTNVGKATEIELLFSMAFEDKEKAIVPILEFMMKLIDFFNKTPT